MSRTAALGVVLAWLCCSCAWAQNESIALVQGELLNLQLLLENAPSSSGLKDLSPKGTEVMQDAANVAVVINSTGIWLYRHSGNNRQLFEKTGAAADKQVVLDAMNSKPYKHLVGVSSFEGERTLSAALSTPQGRTEIAKLLAESKASAYEPKLKELIQARVGEGVLHLSAEEKGELLADASVNQQFRGALGTAMKLEQARVQSIANAEDLTDKAVLTSLKELFQPRDESLYHAYVIRKTEASDSDLPVYKIGADGKGMFTIYLRPKDMAKNPLTGQAINVKRLTELLKSGEIQAYAAERSSDNVKQLPKSFVQ